MGSVDFFDATGKTMPVKEEEACVALFDRLASTLPDFQI
jgi:hypothetical protein